MKGLKLLAFLVIISLACYRYWRCRVENKVEDEYWAQIGCQSPPRWSAKWPLGLKKVFKGIMSIKDGAVLQFLLEEYEASGTTHEQWLLGSRSDLGLGHRTKNFAPLLGSGIFTQDGPAWKHSRALMRPQFASNRYENFEEMRKCVEILIDSFSSSGAVDLQPLFFRLTFDTATFLLFGKPMSSLRSIEVASQESEFAKAFRIGQGYLSKRAQLGDLYWLADTPAFRHACRTSRRFIDQAISQSLETVDTKQGEDKKQYDFIDALIQETHDMKVLRYQCLNILLAGRDATAVCLCWTIYLFSRHPHVLAKLRSEVAAVAGLDDNATSPSRELLKKIKYLDCTLKEVLRLYPSVPVNN
ncbi:cytochrome P450 [Bimuria novae-zelandiae CBS 107.79]|uniref:Cytochrome P450 n=1 Tax=Bimuria novae-zelandiae CBS 107.79 TaxID=1447943 RepID=A0A6A5VSG0_9PLEO|nr:cytochrome P450 [Bimuria novae-zelandiae CBS 107.79]